jgi:hypothetical protein
VTMREAKPSSVDAGSPRTAAAGGILHIARIVAAQLR